MSDRYALKLGFNGMLKRSLYLSTERILMFKIKHICIYVYVLLFIYVQAPIDLCFMFQHLYASHGRRFALYQTVSDINTDHIRQLIC